MSLDPEESDLLEGLIAAIDNLPGGHAQVSHREASTGPRRRVDAIIDAHIAGQSMKLLVEGKRQAFPRDVRETIWQLRSHLAHLADGGQEVVPFFVAQAISPGARDLLRQEGVGFFDLGGSLYIPAKRAFVHIDRPAPRKSSKIFDSVFEGQKARVMHMVFARRDDWLSVKEIAEVLEVSPATASATLSAMERREWLEVEGAGPSKLRRLRSPRALIDAWTSYVSDKKPPKITRYYVPGVSAEEVANRLDQACHRADAAYAVTAEAAAQAYAPYLSSLSQIRCRISPGPRQREALDILGARQVSEGWNLGVIETRTRGDVMIGDQVAGICLAPTLQVYLDLLQGSGRAKEMAAHLRSERLDG